MRPTNLLRLLAAALATAAPQAQGAFLVEAHPSGLANGNFSLTVGVASTSTTPSNAFGVTAAGSVFGGNGAEDIYIFSYTPGTDIDNLTIPAGTDLGNGDLGTGLAGGGSGTYNVYATWPNSTNVNTANPDNSIITVNGDGDPVVIDPVNMNTGGTGDPGGNSAWLKIGTVALTAGNTYTVTIEAKDPTFVSQRAHGVMWEAIPEPATYAVGLGAAALLGAVALRRRRRR